MATTTPINTRNQRSHSTSSPAYEIRFDGDGTDVSVKQLTPVPDIPDAFKPRDKIPRESRAISSTFRLQDDEGGHASRSTPTYSRGLSPISPTDSRAESFSSPTYGSSKNGRYSNTFSNGQGLDDGFANGTIPTRIPKPPLASKQSDSELSSRRRSNSYGDVLGRPSQTAKTFRNLPQSPSSPPPEGFEGLDEIYYQTKIPYPPRKPMTSSEDLPGEYENLDDIYYQSKIPFPAGAYGPSGPVGEDQDPSPSKNGTFPRSGSRAVSGISGSKIPVVSAPGTSSRSNGRRPGSTSSQRMLDAESPYASPPQSPPVSPTTPRSPVGKKLPGKSALKTPQASRFTSPPQASPSSAYTTRSAPLQGSGGISPSPSSSRIINYDDMIVPALAKRLQKEELMNQRVSAYDFVIQEWDRDGAPNPGDAGFEAWKARQEQLEESRRRQQERTQKRQQEEEANKRLRLDTGMDTPPSPRSPSRDARYQAYAEAYSRGNTPGPDIEMQDRQDTARRRRPDPDDEKGGCCGCVVM